MTFETATSWPTESGFVRKGMTVIAADGSVLGVVDRVEGQEVLLEEPGHPFIAVSEIDGIEGGGIEDGEIEGGRAQNGRILLAPRGDASFGLGATP